MAASEVHAQSEPLPPARQVQTHLQEWVRTKQLISQEASEWESEKATLNELNEIRKRETEQLNEFIEGAEVRIKEIATQRAAFEKEEAELKEWRRKLSATITPLERELLKLIPTFPYPLRLEVAEAITQLEARDSSRPLQHRTRDLLSLMQAYWSFHEKLTLDTEIREIDGIKREIEVLYFGMTQAWYVDKSGKHSGVGSPTPTGWVWKEEPSIASTVKRAIDMQTRLEAPGFVRLPITNGSGLE
ncbi:MAG: DUF3450 family protein [Verrucomicrobiales bacterium]|nr:DUF3450 family protein [Verrucomicrobiales bacterium]